MAPLYAAASIGFAYAAMFAGGTLCVVLSFIPYKVFYYIEKYRATWMFMVPIMYDWMFLTPEDVRAKYDTSSLRHVISCGAPLHNATAAKMIDCFKSAEISNWLGSSEFGFITRYSYNNGIKEDGCIGKAIFDLELKLFDNNGNPVKDGESGILYGRGCSMWEGYLDHEWGTVGDIAWLGADGNYYIVDRKNDMIISGGINIYPAEVEGVLKNHESIADNELIEFCRKELAGFKVPKSVDLSTRFPAPLSGRR